MSPVTTTSRPSPTPPWPTASTSAPPLLLPATPADPLHSAPTPTHHYVPNAYYASQMHAGAAHMHVVAPSTMRQDPASQRKRPKYTRSKTGCLTCRAKKIKVSLVRWRP